MILLDTNILLEILESRQRYETVVRVLASLEGQELAITVLTVANTFYIAEKNKLDMVTVENLVCSYRQLDILKADSIWAQKHYNGKDFEDALQVAAARREKCSSFLTLDGGLAKKYNRFLNIELIS